ncbi:MAG: hypothetical protein ACRDDY_03265 [Clostridium sp.]|uniref:hypothetical protein n=1 Tax=Clostridium sp. TaxID=1506 RepID=UPI003EE7B070
MKENKKSLEESIMEALKKCGVDVDTICESEKNFISSALNYKKEEHMSKEEEIDSLKK